MFKPVRLDAGNPGPMTGRGNATYLIADGGSATLIDAGVGESRHLEAVAQGLTAGAATLDRVLATHGHADHVAGAGALAASYPAARFHKYPWAEDTAGPVRWLPLADNERVDAGGESIVVLHTPGHSPDHVAFWHEGTGTIFTGDLVVAGGSVALPWSRGADLTLYLASLERLLALAPARLLPAHGVEVSDPERFLRRSIDHRLARERQIVGELAHGRDTAPTIAESIYDGLPQGLMRAARETVRTHLEKLARDGRAVEADGHWTLT